MNRAPFLAVFALSLLSFLSACGAKHGSDFTDSDFGGSSDAGGGAIVDGGGGVLASDDAGGSGVSPTDGPGEVFGHSDDTLYKLEPISKTVTTVGKFSCVTIRCSTSNEGMWDIALDKDGHMFGSVAVTSGDCSAPTYSGQIVSIDKTTANCSVVGSSPDVYPNSLSFVPAGTIDPSNEVLVGYNQDTYLRIDPTSGATTNIGSLNPNATGQNWYSSGDIVSVIGGKTYLTANPNSSPTGDDSILEIDPVHGTALRVIGDIGVGQVWGLGFWAGTAYGFDEAGNLLSIDLTTGAGTPVPLGGGLSSVSFFGAGNTTAAPLTPPR